MPMDNVREQQVWSRVTAPISGGQSREELRILLLNAREQLELTEGLGKNGFRGRDLLRQIQQLAQANYSVLRGMLVFAGQEAGTLPSRTPSAPMKQRLIRGYYLAKKAAAEYTARSVDPEFGVVYQEMAAREIRICNLIVRLLGENF